MDAKREEILKVEKACSWLEKKLGGRKPVAAVITGSGLADALPSLENSVSFPYAKIPGFFRTTVAGHKGELVFGKFAGREIAVMRGRFHYYEGMPMNQIAVPVRVLYTLGVRSIVVTAAVGSLKKSIKPGDIVVIRDHINFTGSNSLIGNYSPRFGEMFPDMNEPYDLKWADVIYAEAKKMLRGAHKGVYFAVSGPSYETQAEVRAYRLLGGDIAGMSVVPEVIAARQMKMKVLGLAWVSNFASGISAKILEHREVLELGGKVAPLMKKLIARALKTA